MIPLIKLGIFEQLDGSFAIAKCSRDMAVPEWREIITSCKSIKEAKRWAKSRLYLYECDGVEVTRIVPIYLLKFVEFHEVQD